MCGIKVYGYIENSPSTVPSPGIGLSIAVDGAGNVFMVNKEGKIYKLPASNPAAWTLLPNDDQAKSIAVNPITNKVYYLSRTTYGIYEQDGSAWTRLAGTTAKFNQFSLDE
jgi:hypothetical protein